MFLYSLKLAIINLRVKISNSILAALAIAIGIALLTINMTIQYQELRVPLEARSDSLYTVLIDSRGTDESPLSQFQRTPRLTYKDAINLYTGDKENVKKTYLWSSYGYFQRTGEVFAPKQSRINASLHNFFEFFDVPFIYGQAWSKTDDEVGAPVVVLPKPLNDYFFGGKDSVGQSITVQDKSLTIVGVIDDWPLPSRFYDRTMSVVQGHGVFMPSTSVLNLQLPRLISCPAEDRDLQRQYAIGEPSALLSSECGWINYWVDLPEDKVVNYKQFVTHYVEEQKKLGRLQRDSTHFIENLRTYVTESSGRLTSDFDHLLSILFFIVCISNTIGLLMAKYLSNSKEVAIRRALGAKKSTILLQYLIEITIIAFVGASFGLMLTHFGLLGMMEIRLYQTDYRWTAQQVQHLFQLDLTLIGRALLVAVISTVLIIIYPIWRICNKPASYYLKGQ